MKEKKRIIAEVELEDYTTLDTIKRMIGLTWEDLIIAGAVWWVDKMGGEKIFIQRVKEVQKAIAELKKLHETEE